MLNIRAHPSEKRFFMLKEFLESVFELEASGGIEALVCKAGAS